MEDAHTHILSLSDDKEAAYFAGKLSVNSMIEHNCRMCGNDILILFYITKYIIEFTPFSKIYLNALCT